MVAIRCNTDASAASTSPRRAVLLSCALITARSTSVCLSRMDSSSVADMLSTCWWNFASKRSSCAAISLWMAALMAAMISSASSRVIDTILRWRRPTAHKTSNEGHRKRLCEKMMGYLRPVVQG